MAKINTHNLKPAQAQFIKLLEKMSHNRYLIDVFSEVVHMMALSLWSPFALNDHEEVEKEWQTYRDRFTDAEYEYIKEAFALVVDTLEKKREEFLGTVLEAIGAANTHNGQFLTPNSVAQLMAGVTAPDMEDYKPGQIIKMNDPACGASVLLIASAEECVKRGIRQSDLLVEAGDIDRRGCDISYIELSLLGYAAVVLHQDGLSREMYSKPMYTPGYFLHAMPMRLMGERGRARKEAEAEAEGKAIEEVSPDTVTAEEKPHPDVGTETTAVEEPESKTSEDELVTVFTVDEIKEDKPANEGVTQGTFDLF